MTTKTTLTIDTMTKHVKAWFTADRRVAGAVQVIAEDVRHMIVAGNADGELSIYAGIIADCARSDDEKNRKLSGFRTELRRQAKEMDMDKFPTVKHKQGSYAVVWNEWPVGDEAKKELDKMYKDMVTSFDPEDVRVFHAAFINYASEMGHKIQQQLNAKLDTIDKGLDDLATECNLVIEPLEPVLTDEQLINLASAPQLQAGANH